MRNEMLALALGLFVVFGLILTAMYREGQTNIRLEAECKSRGGVLLHRHRNSPLCVDPKSLR